jgi:hypothetical protein
MQTRCVVVIIAILGSGAPAFADFKDVLAQRLSANPDYLVVNMPPRPDAWPGAIFTSNMRIPILHGDPNDPALKRGQPIAIDARDTFDLSARASGGVSSWFNLSAAAGDVADVAMSFPDARVVDMDYGALVKHVQASNETVVAAKRGTIPVIVVKSYEATPAVTLTKKLNASAEAWTKLKTEAEVGAKAAASSENSITYKGVSPVIFAFETQQIVFNPKDLSNGKITIDFAALPNNLFAFRESYTDNILAATTGISVDAIQRHGIIGGPASVFRSPFGP